MKLLIPLIVGILSLQCIENRVVLSNKPLPIEQNTLIGDVEWEALSYTTNPDSILRITYQEKYGSEKTFLCKALFINDRSQQYKLISPSGTIILEKSNIVSISYNQIPIERGDQ
jgi:hypothetical protein